MVMVMVMKLKIEFFDALTKNAQILDLKKKDDDDVDYEEKKKMLKTIHSSLTKLEIWMLMMMVDDVYVDVVDDDEYDVDDDEGVGKYV